MTWRPGFATLRTVGHVDIAGVSFSLPDGRPLLRDVSLRVGEGAKIALIGPNGTGKTTLTRIIAGDLAADEGAVTRSGGLGVMRQFVGQLRDDSTVRDLLLTRGAGQGPHGRGGGRRHRAADDGARHRGRPDGLRPGPRRLGRRRRLRARDPLGHLHRRGPRASPSSRRSGAQVTHPVGRRAEAARARGAAPRTRGRAAPRRAGQLPRRPGQALARGRSSSPRPRPCSSSATTASCSTASPPAIATLEPGAAGATLWVHPGRFATYAQARATATTASRSCASAGTRSTPSSRRSSLMYKAEGRRTTPTWRRGYQAAQTRLQQFEEAGPPEAVPMRAERADAAHRRPHGQAGHRRDRTSSSTGLMKPFDLEVWYGERVAVLGTQRLGQVALPAPARRRRHRPRARAPAGRRRRRPAPVAHTGVARLGSRVRPGWFAQTHEHPALLGRTLLEILHRGDEHRTGQAARGGGPGARPLRAGAGRRSRRSSRCRAASRRGSRSCCSSCRAPRCCCSTSRPTTSTWTRPRRSRRASTRSRAPSSR